MGNLKLAAKAVKLAKQIMAGEVSPEDAKIAESQLQKEYKQYFEQKMDKHDVDSPAELGGDAAKKKFFKEVSEDWSKGKGPK